MFDVHGHGSIGPFATAVRPSHRGWPQPALGAPL